MSSPATRRLTGISPKAYEHPADRAATAALKSIPGLDAVVRKLIEFRYERAFRQGLMAASAELSADRAATLVNRDPLVTARTLMVMAGGIPSSRLELDSFLRQGQDYLEWSSGWDRISRLLNELNLTHSYPVRRVAELMEWVR